MTNNSMGMLLLMTISLSTSFTSVSAWSGSNWAYLHDYQQQSLSSNNLKSSRRLLLFSSPNSFLEYSSDDRKNYFDNHGGEAAFESESRQDGALTDDEIDLQTYRTNLQIGALAKHCERNKNVTAALEAIALLRGLSHPDSVGYNSVLKALAKISPSRIRADALARAQGQEYFSSQKARHEWVDAAQVAQDVLNDMMDLHQRQVKDNQQWYNQLAVAGALTDEQMSQGAPRVRVKPNVRSFSTVMDAYSRIGDAATCHALLDRLTQLYERSGHDYALQPNLITYNTLLSAYAKSGDYVSCLNVMERMQGGYVEESEYDDEDDPDLMESKTLIIQPDVISHNAVLQAMARSGQEDAGEMAEAYLRKTHDGVDDSRSPARLNSRSFTTCMDAWSHTGKPERAHALLNEMIEIYDKTQYRSLAPNVISFSTVIHAYAVSNLPDKALKAQEVFRQMMERNIKTNSVTANALLNACASTPSPSKEVIRLLKGVYKAVLKANQADHYTFGTVLKGCSNFFSTGNNEEFALSVFREACQAGQVSDGVLKQFRHAVPFETYYGIVGQAVNSESTGSLLAEENLEEPYMGMKIPNEWTRNVQQGRRPNNRQQHRQQRNANYYRRKH